MKKIIVLGAIGALAALGFAAPAQAIDEDKCNWGEATRTAVPLGEHSSDQVNPRVGLANVIERGELHLTCEALS